MKYHSALFSRWVGDLNPSDLEEFINAGLDTLILQCQDLYDSDDEFALDCDQMGSVEAMAQYLYSKGENQWTIILL